MSWIQANKGFAAFLALQLVLLVAGTRYVGAVAREGEKLGASNRAAERFVQEEALDQASVQEREQQLARLRRSLSGMEQSFGYAVDPKLKDKVGTNPNRFMEALREVRGELVSSLRIPETLGFPAQQPKAEELRLAVWRLDVVTHILRTAKEAGVEEVPGKDGIKLPKDNLVDAKNYLEYARVEVTLAGKAEALARVVHKLLRPGKYVVLEEVSILYEPFAKGGGDVAVKDAQPKLRLVVAALGLNHKQPLSRVRPESADAAKGTRFGGYHFK